MALGAWYAWPDDPDEDRDLWHILGPNDLLFTVTATDGSTMSFSLTQSDDGLESRLLDSEWNVPMVETDRLPGGGLDPYRAMAVDRIAGMSKHLFGTGLDTDALWDSPAIDELATAFAAGAVSSIRGGATPVVGLDGQTAMTMDEGGWGDDNSPPVAFDDAYYALHDMPLFISSPGVTWNDYDPDADPITAQLDSNPSHAAYFDFSEDGGFAYDPTPGYVGTDNFTYHVTDGIANSAVATVTLEIGNTPPNVEDDGPYLVATGGSVVVVPPGVQSNDGDSRRVASGGTVAAFRTLDPVQPFRAASMMVTIVSRTCTGREGQASIVRARWESKPVRLISTEEETSAWMGSGWIDGRPMVGAARSLVRLFRWA